MLTIELQFDYADTMQTVADTLATLRQDWGDLYHVGNPVYDHSTDRGVVLVVKLTEKEV